MTELERRTRELAEVLGIARDTKWEEALAATSRLVAVNKAVLPASHHMIVGPQIAFTTPETPLRPGDAHDTPPMATEGTGWQETR